MHFLSFGSWGKYSKRTTLRSRSTARSAKFLVLSLHSISQIPTSCEANSGDWFFPRLFQPVESQNQASVLSSRSRHSPLGGSRRNSAAQTVRRSRSDRLERRSIAAAILSVQV